MGGNKHFLHICYTYIVREGERESQSHRDRDGERMSVRATLKVYFIYPLKKQYIRISTVYTEPCVRPLGRML